MFKNQNKRVFFTIFFIFFSLFSTFSKDKTFIKYVHPRIYEFDLCDAEKTIFLGLNETKVIFDAKVDFTRFVRKDMPKAGDKVIFHYKGYALRDAGFITAQIYDKTAGKKLSHETKLFGSNVKKKVELEGTVSFILDEDSISNFTLVLTSNKKNKPFQLDQVYFKFYRVVETTDTEEESINEEKAKKENIEIIEVKTDVKSDEEEAREKAEQERLLQEQLEKKRAEKEEQERIKKELLEKERLEKEILETEEKQKQLESINQALQNANKVQPSRYQKEFLQDYMSDYAELPDKNNANSEEKFIESPNQTDSNGRTLLMQAAKLGNDWQIKLLLNSGADVNLKDKDGWTALMYAVRYQENLETVKLLLTPKTDIKAKNNFGSSALLFATCYNSNPEILKTLLEYYSISETEVLKSFTQLLSQNLMMEYIQIEKIKIFINKSIQLNTFYEGKTPLMYAAQYGNSTKIIKLLIDNGSITTVRSTEGKTAFNYATKNTKLNHDENYWALNKK